jgi:glycerol-3-phosphate dehydrogenase
LLDHESTQGVPGLISVAGIKYTTAPVTAAKTVELVFRKLRRDPKAVPFEQPATGAGDRLAPVPADDDEQAWARRIYGTRAAECLGDSGSMARDGGEVFRRRVRYGIDQEMVVRLSDALLRATDWAERGLLTQEQLAWCAATLAAAHDWSHERTEAELATARADLDKLHIALLEPQPARRRLA